PFGAGIEVDETFVHNRSAFAYVSPKANAGSVCNTDTFGNHVVCHLRELVYGFYFQSASFQPGFQLALWQFIEINRAFTGPGQVWQQPENAIQLHLMWPGNPVRDKVQLQVNLGCA